MSLAPDSILDHEARSNSARSRNEEVEGQTDVGVNTSQRRDISDEGPHLFIFLVGALMGGHSEIESHVSIVHSFFLESINDLIVVDLVLLITVFVIEVVHFN